MDNRAAPYPILANSSDFENEAQVEKINTIIKGQYNYYLEKTLQKKDGETQIRDLVQSYSNSAADVVDYNYGDFCFITFDINTSGMDYDTSYPVLKIKKGSRPLVRGVKAEVTFVGVDDNEDWKTVLNEYGEFQFSYNRLTDEQQIVFRTFTKTQLTDGNTTKPIPQTVYHVTMTFHYSLAKES